jgi:hypothetical protein
MKFQRWRFHGNLYDVMLKYIKNTQKKTLVEGIELTLAFGSIESFDIV